LPKSDKAAAEHATDIVVELVTLEPNEDGTWPEPPDGRVVITFEDGRTWREGDP